jgi:hypothetical protein
MQETAFYRRAYVLALITVLYNIIEGLVSTALGADDETLALFGFGLDSFIESISGFGVVIAEAMKANRSSYSWCSASKRRTSSDMLRVHVGIQPTSPEKW